MIDPKDFKYDPVSGDLFRYYAGRWKKAYRKSKNGYLRVKYKQKDYLAHRVCWFLYYGHFPKQQIDHINGDTTDNSIENMQDVPIKTNLRNQKKRKNNTSGYTGVCFHKSSRLWRGRLRIDGKEIVKYFHNPQDAGEWASKMRSEAGFSERHGK